MYYYLLYIDSKQLACLGGFLSSKNLSTRLNNQIRAVEVRLIDQNGNDLGIMPTANAMNIAASAELDLVEVSQSKDYSVCKILDYGKEKYEAEKKKKLAKKNSQATALKEVRLTARIDEHDYNVKIKRAIKFLTEDKDKVLVTIVFRGRELDYKEIAYRIVNKVKDDLLEVAKIDSEPKLDRRRMNMVFSPIISKSVK